MDKKAKSGKKKSKSAPESGIAHIRATFNNTIVTISDLSGNVGFLVERRSAGF